MSQDGKDGPVSVGRWRYFGITACGTKMEIFRHNSVTFNPFFANNVDSMLSTMGLPPASNMKSTVGHI
ncbi:hypothetical protein XELAEV_18002014mg [Xenopus laevis]|uniref:Uncharacterized protein n=1 Tax=Xenopus laevis TaxID=8355 RepID=A0A974BP86_XENLA|nr:hypothetical protein XELAEV_18002014mg [Xenopus laevis]